MADTDFNEEVQIPSSVASVFSNPASTITRIAEIEIHNTNSSAEVVSIHKVPNSGGSVGAAADSNRKHRIAVQANDTIFVPLKFPYILTDTNDSIQAATTTASKVNITIKGVKST